MNKSIAILVLVTIIFDVQAQWEWQNPFPHGNSMYAISFINENEGWVGGNSIVVNTINGGSTWHMLAKVEELPCGECRINSVSFVDSQLGWAAGACFPIEVPALGRIWITNDGGETWQTQAGIISAIVYDIYFKDELEGWAVGDTGVILRTNNGGDQWNLQESNSNVHFCGVTFLDDDMGWVVGDNSIYHTTNGGITWDVQLDSAEITF